MWIWGPPLWEFLHCVAFYSDTKLLYNPEQLAMFFQMIHRVLPCVYCRDSYGELNTQGILQKTIDAYGSIQSLVPKRQLTTFVYRLHEFVNQKLLAQKWTNLLERNPACSLPFTEVWSLLQTQPSIDIIYKRQIFNDCELHLNSMWLLALAFAQRTSKETEENIKCFLSILIQTLKASSFLNARSMGFKIEACGTTLHLLFQAYKSWLEEESGRMLSDEEFMHSTQHKLNVMISTGCGKGTCK